MNNHQSIKVSEALKKGNKWINIPCYLFLLCFFFIVPAILLYVFRYDKSSVLLIFLSVSSIILGIVLPFFWWSINVVKYKIWAAKNVKDIHRFYEEAQTKNLINENKIFRKLEIKSEKQQKELAKFYERLLAEKVLVRDLNNSILKETVFKSALKWNVLIYLILMVGLVYLYQIGQFNLKGSLIFAGILTLLVGLDLYKLFKNKYILKINNEFISYKDNKELIYWKDIIDYRAIPGIQNNPSKLIVHSVNKDYELQLENYGSIKLGKVIDVLNENKHRFDINQSVR